MATTNIYQRSTLIKRGKDLVKINNLDAFPGIIYQNAKQSKEEINGVSFESFHHITGNSDQVILTAYKSVSVEDVLFISWADFPYLNHIEVGGDLMLQELKNNNINYLLIDNTFVQSGWVNDKVLNYFDKVWYPGLIELGLKGFVHIQAQSALGTKSFDTFRKDIQDYLEGMASKMNKKSFIYYPMESTELEKIEKDSLRKDALKKGLSKITELKGLAAAA